MGIHTGALDDRREPTAHQVEHFGDRGWVRVDGVLTPDEVAAHRGAIGAAVERVRSTTAPLEQRSTYGKAFLQLMNLWRVDPVIERLVLAPRLAGLAAALLGVERVRVYHDQALFKEPGGGVTPWHQDALYWPLDGRRCITMWMPLIDVVPEMGTMTFAEGSHRAGRLGDAAISDESEADFARLVDGGGFGLGGPGALSAGDATFHAGWTLHRASPNVTGTMREVMTVIWFADGLVVQEPANREQHRDLATWLPGCRPGDPAASPLNPLVPSPAPAP